jgi:hypothetical protein
VTRIRGRLRNREIDGSEFKRLWERVDEVVAKQMGESEEREEVGVEKGEKRQVRDDEGEEGEESERQGRRKRTKTTSYVVLSDEGEEEQDELESTLDESAKPAAVGMQGRGVTRGRGRGGKKVVGPFRPVSGKVSKPSAHCLAMRLKSLI